jgi:peptidoglycan/LPS O-acetylase OafA/YrhL
VATAELLAGAARLNMPIERDGREDLRRAGLAAVAGAGVFGAVALVGTLPGPTGLVAVALASGACIVLALLLVRSEPNKRPSDS